MQLKTTNSIKSISNPSKEKFLELWKQYRPFIINDVVGNWDAHKRWSNNYLIKIYGDNIVPVETNPPSFFEDYNFTSFEHTFIKEMKFKEYINVIAKDAAKQKISYYLAQLDIFEHFPKLAKDIVNPDYLGKKADPVYIFFGSNTKNSSWSVQLHFDPVHNIFAQIRGRKRILLFPPVDYRSYYPPIEDRKYSPTCSKVNPDQLDLESYPKFPWSKRIEVILESGQMIYIPPLWWHHVTPLDENISVSFWYLPTLGDFLKQKGMLSAFIELIPQVPRIFSNLSYSHKDKLVNFIKDFLVSFRK